jgi:predicted amino acid-binding ACT domain protein
VAEQVPPVPAHECQVFQLTLTGNDPPGVLARFSARLAREQIDITDMYGWRSGEESPVILLELAIPTHVNIAELRAELTDIGRGFGLDTRLDFVRTGTTRDPRPLRTRLPTGSQPVGER